MRTISPSVDVGATLLTPPGLGAEAAAPARLQPLPRGADDLVVRQSAGLAAPLALAAAALLAVPAAGAASPAAPATAPGPAASRLPALQEQLTAATADAVRLADALDAAAARDGGLRVEIARLAERQEEARSRVAARARQAYLAGAVGGPGDPAPLSRLVVGLAAADLRALASAELGRRGAAGAVRETVRLADAVDASSAAARALQEHAAAFRAALQEQAAAALAAQERARVLLAETEAAVAAEQATAARSAADARSAAAARAVAAARAELDRVSATVTAALTPAQTRRSRDAAAREAPLVALAEAAGAGYPAGYAATGTVLHGEASWYGPGFVGNPTASGAPYDPERLTCAHRTLPLGTLVRVSRDGRAISCLVNDRGPYVGDRVLDLSRAGSRALGFDGVAQVTVEVLAASS